MSERLSDYDYHLPEELIAQTPVDPRDSSRLLVIDRKKGTWEHRTFRDLKDYLDEKDLLVANNTKVLKARLLGNRVIQCAERSDGLAGLQLGGKTEFVLLEEKSSRVWEGLFHASAKYLPGLQFFVPTPDGKGLRGKLISSSADSPSGTVVVEFDRDPLEADAGEIPLPKYIRRGDEKTFIPSPDRPSTSKNDLISYQTVYSKELGSAAAPTAGLHFTDRLIKELRAKSVEWTEVTLHVGVGTFRPVKTENISEHVMHEERFELKAGVAREIEAAKKQGKRVVAVGTTSVRTLESAAVRGHLAGQTQAEISSLELNPGFGRTSLFIRPGHFEFQVVDRLITNFHLPKSSLLMLVSAFAGREFVLEAYKEAVRQKYRFFSYGDAMLIL
jgi:S-adenosylmethionine:tRNA ribosyltransferase-isomerase